MLHIRRIYDDVIPVNKGTLDQVKQILRTRFSGVHKDEIERLGEKLLNQFKQRFRMILFVAESIKGRVRGFATILHEPEIRFVYLDWIATASSRSSGVGGALYERVRQEAKALEAKGLFFECLPDDAENCSNEALLKENRARLRFYERYGARPIVGTAYESSVSPDDTCMPHLVYDGLDNQAPLRNRFARKVIQAILDRKYVDYCPADYVEKVVASFKEDPVRLRPFRYVKPEAVKTTVEGRPAEQITLVVNDRHDIHHVHERGYVESPVRIKSILESLEPSGLFARISPRTFPEKHLYAVHDHDFVRYLKKACADVSADKT
ncbi:MAG: acetylpolyamine amidohydrolase, partial [Desulfobacterales bacterium]|nr:acetylpolyamine amidohydrolase [Desulfobacterales bacterium]